MLTTFSIWSRFALSVLLWIVLLPVMLILLPFRTGRSASHSALPPVQAPVVAVDSRDVY
ncbi:hypothetical protein [Rathayibacter rathayi]|uniref:hypothetical protein n=1 Tax=Rathayibacter rathayi TaxID=33887 RepID=UPI000BD5F075|nr:hypothetical protein [Rathayibacter rathayi]MWV73276.1 hypothetical protein [Rathayibacter rathayi NCPPB 2980 = VKM Ac-1601]TWD69681.1 hypothetical protein FB469_1430 [Rathayibacter rathayi]SOE02730.1 hypothetical protein SAMN06295924_101549 [Rathayibacter rathayi NCPPB 2980 = VKM Ac-1601]